jgi:hypothetical protein
VMLLRCQSSTPLGPRLTNPPTQRAHHLDRSRTQRLHHHVSVPGRVPIMPTRGIPELAVSAQADHAAGSAVQAPPFLQLRGRRPAEWNGGGYLVRSP